MRPFYFIVSSMLIIAGCNTAEKNIDSKWKLVWSDDFTYSGLPDSTKWNQVSPNK